MYQFSTTSDLSIPQNTQKILNNLYNRGGRVKYVYAGFNADRLQGTYFGSFAALTSEGKLISWGGKDNNGSTIPFNNYGEISDYEDVSEGFIFVDNGKLFADFSIPDNILKLIGTKNVVDVVSAGNAGFAALLEDGDVVIFNTTDMNNIEYTESELKSAGIENITAIYGGSQRFFFIREDGNVIEVQDLKNPILQAKTITFANGIPKYIATNSSGLWSKTHDQFVIFVDENGWYLTPTSGMNNSYATSLTRDWTKYEIKSVTLGTSIGVIQDLYNKIYLTQIPSGLDLSADIPEDMRYKIESKKIRKVVIPSSAATSGILTTDNTLYTFDSTVDSSSEINGFTNFKEIKNVSDAACSTEAGACYYQLLNGKVRRM